MKVKSLKTAILTLITIFTISCSKDDSSSSTDTGGTTTVTNTWVKLTAITASGVTKPNYIIMMFDQPFSPSATIPPILKQVTTDSNGLAYFDLNSMITSSTLKKYYFEAFVQSGSNYILKSTIRYSTDLKKGTMVTSSTIVN